MAYRNLLCGLIISVAALVGATGANAQTQVQPGNYQTHVVPNTTHRVGHSASSHSRAHYDRNIAENSRARGNYQSHVLANSTRRNSDNGVNNIPIHEPANDRNVACTTPNGKPAC